MFGLYPQGAPTVPYKGFHELKCACVWELVKECEGKETSLKVY